MKIALVTYEDKGKYAGEGTTEDNLLLKYLLIKGLDVQMQIWTDPHVQWEKYDWVILKSPWDYFDKIELFRQWLDVLDKKGIRVLNPTAVVRWNTDKSYLLEIEKAGFAIVPTAVIPPRFNQDLNSYFDLWETENIILKPAVSGGAKNTFAFSQKDIARHQEKVNQLLNEEAFLVQPYMPEITLQGEWSLLFFNHQFSHAVRKLPQNGDFRVQHYFGGAILPDTPPPAVLEYAQKLVNQFAPGCLYARVDGLETPGDFKLMELELIEPLLYLQNNEALFNNYYQALVQIIND